LLPNQIFPKEFRNELRLTCALHGYLAMQLGDGMTYAKQQEFLKNFYHGENNKSPSQIKMLAEGIAPYDDLYSSKPVSILTAKGKGSKDGTQKKRYLKENLSRELNRLFYIGDQITHCDLEKKNDLDLHLLMGVSYLKW
jgi:hypothetical protein